MRLNNLELKFETFENIQDQIESKVNEENIERDFDSRTEHENKYYDVISLAYFSSQLS